MRWRQGRRSDNVEDQRGQGGGFGGGFRLPGGRGRLPGGGMRVPVRRGGMSLTMIIIMIVLFFIFGGDLGSLLQQAPIGAPEQRQTQPQFPQLPETGSGSATRTQPGGGAGSEPGRTGQGDPRTADELADFIKVVLGSTEDTWNKLFEAAGQRYREPTLVIFSGAVRSACGFAQAAVGPFYCPGDQKVYIDLSFYNDLKNRFRAPGDFAQAYVIAHEVGHHIQTLLGISEQVRAEQARASKTEANAIQVRMELQADCLAGIWAHHAERASTITLEAGDIEEALGAANAIGDDRLQRQSQGYVVPDAFTHGSSEQRMRWFNIGFDSGSMRSCDTFSASRL